ncbi:MAG: hypothetical protein ACI9R3_004516 [Verrucomicrobiales bacterium]|jgi:hypothetical protein
MCAARRTNIAIKRISPAEFSTPLIPSETTRTSSKASHVTSYDYLDADGTPKMQVRRYLYDDGKKTFRQFHWTGSAWKSGLNGNQSILFGADKIAAADPKRLVFIAEGEKDVLTLEANGLVATTNPMAASKWRDHFSDALAGRHCVILPDHDKPGKAHRNVVAESLKGKVAAAQHGLDPLGFSR